MARQGRTAPPEEDFTRLHLRQEEQAAMRGDSSDPVVITGSIGDKIWEGLKKFPQTDFAKGMAVTAGLAIVAGAIAFAIAASMGSLALFPLGMAAPPVAATIGQGIMIGIGQALTSLVHPIGLGALTVGGFAGMYIGKQHENARKAAEDSENRARQAEEKAKALALEKLKEKPTTEQTAAPAQPEKPQNDMKTAIKTEHSFLAAELKRRVNAQARKAVTDDGQSGGRGA